MAWFLQSVVLRWVWACPMRTASELIANIREDDGLAELCESLGIDLLVVFGSTVTDPDTARDVDLAYFSLDGSDPLEVSQAFLDPVR